jgi:hypothetical protein
MAGGDLEVVLDWAAGENWNPGRHDAAAFEAVDPDGLLIGLVDGEPVAAIACPRYDERFGFVGLYLVRGDHRGSGLACERWGYRAEGHTYRYAGRGPQGAPEADICSLHDVPWGGVLDVDACGFPARRERFLRLWTTQPQGRALALRSEGRVTGYGVLRRCREGYKVGPLFARDRRGAESLLDAS